MPVNNFLITWDPTNKKWTAREDGGAAYDLVENSLHETVQYNEIAAPAVSAVNTAKMYMDSTTKRVMHSQNTSAFQRLIALTTKGDLQTFSTIVTRLAVGADGTQLEADSTQATGLKWGTKTTSPLTTKGDLWTYAAADARLPIGADYRFLVGDTAQSTGLKWFLPPYCEVYRSGGFATATATSYNITWNGETADASNMCAGGIYLTAPVEGLYLVEWSLDWAQASSNYRLRLYPSSGSDHIKQYYGSGTPAGVTFYPHCAMLVRLPTSGTVYCQIAQWTGGNRNACYNTTWTRLFMTWIAPYD
jgi:hypothetical protein